MALFKKSPANIVIGGGKKISIPGPGLKSRFKALYSTSVDPAAPLNRMGTRLCNLIELLSGGIQQVVPNLNSDVKNQADGKIPDHLGERNFPKLKGAHRDDLNRYLHKHGHIDELDRLIAKHHHLKELHEIEHMALRKPESAGAMLINWYGTLGHDAPDSEFYDEKHEKKRYSR